MIAQKVAATERYQDVAIEEGARAEDAEAQGEIFQWQAQENRTNNDVARYQSMYQGFAAQQNNAEVAQVGAWTQVAASAGQIGGAAAGNMPVSDRRLKKNIKLIGKSSSGLKIYAFEYINKIFGEGIWQGVMSDEIQQEAVIKHLDGYDRVDYSKLDVEFKRI